MLVQQLKRLEPFCELRAAELHTVARHAQLLSLPAARWLLRPERRLSGAYYLLRGRLQLWQPQRQLSGQEPSAMSPFYPGANAVFTQTAVQVLHINTAPIEFLWAAVEQGGLQSPVPDDAWLTRFLSSPLLQHLEPAHWQQLLRSADERLATAGEAVVQAGTPGDEFFVLKRGRALVQRHGTTVAFLGPGDFFGEDALVTGAPRNATVTMQVAGSLLVLPKHRFLQSLVARVITAQTLVVQRQGNPNSVQILWVAAQPPVDTNLQHMPLRWFREKIMELDYRQRYLVAGGSLPDRALAILLLAQQGICAGYAAAVPEGSNTLAHSAKSATPAPSGWLPMLSTG